MTTTDRWVYCGDVNLVYGGAFIDLSTWDDGYCDAVRVTDIDSGCGFTGAVMIEHVTINGTRDAKRIRDALRSCGNLSARNWAFTTDKAHVKQCLRHAIADALMSYGHTDPDDNWDGQWHGCSEAGQTEIVQMEADGPMRFDGWKADKRLRGDDLEGYVKAVHLS